MSALRWIAAERSRLMELIADEIAAALAAAPHPSLVLAGGQTPKDAYHALSEPNRAGRCDWSRVQFWFGDERCVAPEHPLSNYGMAEAALLEPLEIAPQMVHRMLGELGSQEGARRYAAQLARDSARASFSVALLGMGHEGHTASLFPGSAALTATDLARGVRVPAAPPERITLTPRALCAARRVFFLICGEAKGPALRKLREAVGPDPAVPTSYVHGQLETAVFCDLAADAASRG